MRTGLELFSLTNEDYYTIFENMQEGITVYRIIYDNSGKIKDLIIKYANPASSTSKVFLNRKFTGKSITKLYGSKAISSFLIEANEIVSAGQIKKYETYSPLIDSYFLISAFSPAKNLYVTLTADITEQKKAENYLQNANDNLESKVQERTKELSSALEEKELLLREIHHRVNNSLQLISSLMNIQAPYIKDDESIEFFKKSQSRVKSISMIHEKLYQSKNLQKIDFGDYLSSIIINLFQTYVVDQEKIRYNLKCNSIKLNMETAIPCGLILTELITNSLKHSFGNEISVEMYLENETFNLIVKDNGIGFPEDLDFQNIDSLGLQLVNLLVNQLDGAINLKDEYGAEFKIEFKELEYRKRIKSR